MSTNNTIDQLITGVMIHGPDILKHTLTDADLTAYTARLDKERLDYPVPPDSIDINEWFMPKEYKDLDIENFLIDQCPNENRNRLAQELALYRQNNMMSVLRVIKYIVDTLRKNNVVWGVGRGSSVASYALYLIGIHKIDSVKYNLPLEEFFKGE